MMLSEQLSIIKGHQKQAPVEVVPIAQELGMDVYRVPGWPDNLSGMIRLAPEDDERYAIYVNGDHHLNRRRFTIAHETAHFVLHKNQIGDGIVDDALYRSGLSNRIEAQANRLAAEILMPWHLLDPYIDTGIDDVGQLAKIFVVSRSAMSIRLGVPFETQDDNQERARQGA